MASIDLDRLRSFVSQSGGIAPAARRLNVDRKTLLHVIAGAARRGTELLVAQELQRLTAISAQAR
jgi:hypothetical protein